jgi:hypothetical protein
VEAKLGLAGVKPGEAEGNTQKTDSVLDHRRSSVAGTTETSRGLLG